MPEQDPTSDAARRTLSEISHLFLSDVRDRHAAGAARPQRVAPGARPNETAFPRPAASPQAAAAPPIPPVTAVIGAHLGGGQFDRVRQYAGHLAARVGRVGLIEVDADEMRLTCFEAAADARTDAGAGDRWDEPESEGAVTDDPRDAAEAIEELNADVSRWLLSVSQPRRPEGEALLAGVGHWALLSTCDHDGVVGSYRMLKGLADAPRARRPRLTLSLVDGDTESEMVRVFRKLAGVSEQFLDWPIEPEPAVRPAPGVGECPVLTFRPAPAAPGRPAAHWAVLYDFVTRAEAPAPAAAPAAPARPQEPAPAAPEAWADEAAPPAPAITPEPPAAPAERRPPPRPMTYTAAAPAPTPVAPPMAVAASPTVAPSPMKLVDAPAAAAPAAPTLPADSANDAAEVLDLSGPNVSVEAILDAILGRRDGGLVECPVRAPMCSSARLAIGRDRRVVLLAVAREGLSELRSIGQAWRWLVENRTLIGMAVPQLAIDAQESPRLRLLVDQADVTADVLQPMLHSGHVTVQAYRRIRWAGRTGLLLDAA